MEVKNEWIMDTAGNVDRNGEVILNRLFSGVNLTLFLKMVFLALIQFFTINIQNTHILQLCLDRNYMMLLHDGYKNKDTFQTYLHNLTTKDVLT